MDDVTPERWLPVPGYSNYEVSDHGRIWSRPRVGTPGGILRQSPASNGYPGATLLRGKGPAERRTLAVHVLVALAFLGPRPPGCEICHNDGDRANSRLSNLRYDTISANRQDAVRHGTHRNTRKTHCPKDHEYTPENTYITPQGVRQCRLCAEAEARKVQRDLIAENVRLRHAAGHHREPWTDAELQVVASHPELRAAELAVMLGRTRRSVDYARKHYRIKGKYSRAA